MRYLMLLFLLIILAQLPSYGKLTLTDEEKKYLADHNTIIFTGQSMYPPFEFIENTAYDGMTIELIRWLGAELGFNPEFLPTSFAEAQKNVIDGKADVLTSFFFSVERDKLFDFTSIVFEIPGTIFVKKDRPDIKNLQDLNNKIISVQEGDYALEFLKEKNIKYVPSFTKNFAEATDLVLNGKADALIGDEQIVLYHVYKSGKSDLLKKAGEPLFIGQDSMAVKDGNKVLLSIINKGIDHARNSGIITKIYRKWLGTELSQNQNFWVTYGSYIKGVTGLLVFMLAISWYWNRSLKKQIKHHTRALQNANELLKNDIDKRIRIENDLKASEEKYRVLVAKLPDIILVHEKGKVAYINDEIYKAIGFKPEQLIGKQIFEFIHPDDRELVKKIMAKREHNENVPDYYEIRILTSTHDYHDFEVRASMIEYNLVAMTLTVLTDVTQRKAAERALVESEENYRNTVEMLPVGVYEFDKQGFFTYANAKAMEMFGYSIDNLFHTLNVLQVIVPEDHARAQENIKKLMGSKDNLIGIYTAVKKDSSLFPIEIHSNVYYRNGEPCGLRGIIIDITEKKRMEEEALRTNKLESVGLLAGGIAHDFNNILTAIVGNINLTKMKINDRNLAEAYLSDAAKACQRAKDLTFQLLTFAKGGEPVRENAVLNDIIKDSASFSLRGSNCTGDFTIAEDLWMSAIDRGQFSRVIHNIVINAVQAMSEGGTVKITAENTTVPADNEIKLHPGAYVCIRISDNGNGIPQEQLQKIFDPYYTTKHNGSGLGLAIVFSIISKHQGKIIVESEMGHGSCFSIYLPAIKAHEIDKKQDESKEVFFTDNVLFMDDEDMLRSVAKGMLEHFGCTVTLAVDGVDAIEKYKQSFKKVPFSIMIFDLTVPGKMGGLEAVKEIRMIDKNIPVIVTSGYTDASVMSRYSDYGFTGMLQKPFTIDDIRKILNEIHENDA